MLDHPAKILIVEDNALLGLILKEMVEDLGRTVVGPYLNLSDGLDHAAEDDLDFALLDFDLGDGVDAAPIVEVLTRRHVPFAFTTGTPPATIRESFPRAIVIGKPVIEEELRALLQ